MRQVWVVALLVLMSHLAFGASEQKIKVNGTEPLSVVLSQSDYSRISMGDGRKVHQVMAGKGLLSVTQEPSSGTAIVRPTSQAPSQLSVFVKDDRGKLYTLAVQIRDMPSQHIIIQPHAEARAKSRALGRQGELRKSTNALFKVMYTDDTAHGYEVLELDQKIPLWKEASIRLVKSYRGDSKIGYVYELTNTSNKPLLLHESEFFEFVPAVIAVGLQSSKLQPGQSTRLFVVGAAIGESS